MMIDYLMFIRQIFRINRKLFLSLFMLLILSSIALSIADRTPWGQDIICNGKNYSVCGDFESSLDLGNFTPGGNPGTIGGGMYTCDGAPGNLRCFGTNYSIYNRDTPFCVMFKANMSGSSGDYHMIATHSTKTDWGPTPMIDPHYDSSSGEGGSLDTRYRFWWNGQLSNSDILDDFRGPYRNITVLYCIDSANGNLSIYMNDTLKGTDSSANAMSTGSGFQNFIQYNGGSMSFFYYISWNGTLAAAPFFESIPADNFPYYDSVLDNSTLLTPNATDTIGLSIHLLDDKNISYLFTMWNMTGTWANFSSQFIGQNNTNITVEQPILWVNNKTIGYRMMFNDSANQWNFTGINTFIAYNISDYMIPPLPDSYPVITISEPLNWSPFIMGVDTIHMLSSCADDNNASNMNVSIIYGGDTLFDYFAYDNFINQYHYFANNLTQDIYSLVTSCTDNASQTTYDYSVIIIYNYFNMSILVPYMGQKFFVPDAYTQADINMTWVINQFAYCCDLIDGVEIGCDYVPADVETYNQYLLTLGIYNITRACTLVDSYATIQDYRIVHVEIPITPYCTLSNEPLYYNENVTITGNIVSSELSWVEFIWNNTRIYNRSFMPGSEDIINITNSIKNRIPINDSVQFGYNFSDSINSVISCYNTDISIERPSTLSPNFEIGVCPSTVVGFGIAIFIFILAIIFVVLGFFAPTFGIFGGLILLLFAFSFTACQAIIGIILIVVSLLLMAVFAIKMVHE